MSIQKVANPIISKGDTVLVTGVTGFIANSIALELIKAGYKVKGTARNPEKVKIIEKVANALKPGYFTWVEVKDIAAPDAFDKAVVGVQGIVHAASYVEFPKQDPNVAINIAIGGTLNILNAVQKYGKDVKTVSVTSSVVAANDVLSPALTYVDETLWNLESEEICKRDKEETEGFQSYQASKSLAERALWKWRDDNKPKFQLSTVLPVFVTGPYFDDPSKPSLLPSSLRFIFDTALGSGPLVFPNFYKNAVDVRDVARLHIATLENPKANGERFLANAPWHLTEDMIYEQVSKHYKELLPKFKTPGPGPFEEPIKTIDGTKATKVLGLEYLSKEQSALDTLRSLVNNNSVELSAA